MPGDSAEGEGGGGIRGSRRRLGPRRAVAPLRGAAALCLCLVLGGCGLEEYLYFYPPTVSAKLSVTPLVLEHNRSNDSVNFLGYDVYYLLVDAENDTFLSSCVSKVDNYIGTKTPGELIAAIKALGFKPLIGFDSSAKQMTQVPLFQIAASGLTEDIDFSLYIGASGDVSITGDGASYVTAPTYVRRNSQDSAKNYRSFANLTVDSIEGTGDTAYREAYPQPSKILFCGYVFAHGVTSSWGDVFSNPVRIGDSSQPELAGTFE